MSAAVAPVGVPVGAARWLEQGPAGEVHLDAGGPVDDDAQSSASFVVSRSRGPADRGGVTVLLEEDVDLLRGCRP